MIRINQLKLPVLHEASELKKRAARALRIRESEIRSLTIAKRSLDARKKSELRYIYTVDVEIDGREEAAVRRAGTPDVMIRKEGGYRFPAGGSREGAGKRMRHRPVVIGCGPAGLFSGLFLARAGYRPILLERGEPVEERKRTVESFWAGGPLCPDSNVQFGEGGAGTFSDGKLNTLVKDPSGRNQEVLRVLSEAGADPSILYVNKPHIGTDVLSRVVRNLREEILRLGGEVRFGCKVTDLIIEDGAVCGLELEPAGNRAPGSREDRKKKERLPAEAVILAVGHSARDTFEMLCRRQVEMQAKAFAVGFRIQHPQRMINLSQYGLENPGSLGAAEYKLTAQTRSGRGVYTFCMCPGGYVVNASSEAGRLAINGMSNHSRDGKNANSALIVTVTPEDYPDASPLGGVAFQRKLEEAAYACAGGRIPLQLYGDFRENRPSSAFGELEPAIKGGFAFGDLRAVLPGALSRPILEGMESFGRRIEGFDRPDAILAGVESRTSSPVRIPRGDWCESSIKGLYPCGEGAGYAGGITSAAMDGIRVAEAVASKFAPL